MRADSRCEPRQTPVSVSSSGVAARLDAQLLGLGPTFKLIVTVQVCVCVCVCVCVSE
jgi:hypothetical protein